jgi:arsenical pump membrane protein
VSLLGWAIAAAAIVAVLVRPFRINEAWWAAAGGLLLLACGAIAPPAALAALGRGVDVYLFLIGMMALAEFARTGGLFDWVAARAIDLADGSRLRLLVLVYGAGIVTTALLSNDATIVVLTPAVIAALRRIDAKPPAYAIACALVANAASFVLPISNPSNLLVFAGRMPALGVWLGTFAFPSVAALAITFAILAAWFRADLRGRAAPATAVAEPGPERLHALVLAAAAVAIVATSAREGPLGLTTFACAAVAWLVARARRRGDATAIARGIAWPVVALTAGLFVIVSAVDAAGGLAATHAVLAWCAALETPFASLATGFVVAAASNLANNLPVGLNLGEGLPAMHAAPAISAAALIGVNLGPNATVNGSLATILWLAIMRRENVEIAPLRFAAIGTATAIPALAAALALVR